jgi:hypothetical protein
LPRKPGAASAAPGFLETKTNYRNKLAGTQESTARIAPRSSAQSLAARPAQDHDIEKAPDDKTYRKDDTEKSERKRHKPDQ